MQDHHFEWDDAKAESNRRKHGVTFYEARQVFDDPFGIDVFDDDPDEERWQHIGMGPAGVLIVVYTLRNVRTRIITAREANRHEQDTYYRQARP